MGTVPSPYSPIAGDDATQARVLTWADAANYLLGNATSGGSKRPLAVLRQTVAQSLTTGVVTAVTMDTEDVDYDNGHSTVTNTDRYTCQTTGWYLVTGVGAFAASAAGERYVAIGRNGSALQGATVRELTNTAAGLPASYSVSVITTLTAGTDWVSLLVMQASAGALNTSIASDVASRLQVQWISV